MYAPPQRKLALRQQDIDVWLAFCDDFADERRLSSLRMLLSDAEREQEKRFHFADDRRRYLVTRAMVRTVLSRYTTVSPTDWVFLTNEYGRPEMVNRDDEAPGLCFNVSHTCGLIALGVCRRRALGVDVENVMARRVSIGIADRFFSPREVAELASAAHERRQDRQRLGREAPVVTMRTIMPTFEDEAVDVALLKTSEMPQTGLLFFMLSLRCEMISEAALMICREPKPARVISRQNERATAPGGPADHRWKRAPGRPSRRPPRTTPRAARSVN